MSLASLASLPDNRGIFDCREISLSESEINPVAPGESMSVDRDDRDTDAHLSLASLVGIPSGGLEDSEFRRTENEVLRPRSLNIK